jgi:hypothetical protein
MTIKQMLENEARSMGRPVELVDYAKLDGGVTIIVYDSKSQPLEFSEGKRILHDRRFAISFGSSETNVASGIVSSKWEDV